MVETTRQQPMGILMRIGLDIDPKFGAISEFVAMTRMAVAFNAVVIDDVVPAHSGKGADFRLAEMRYEEYPGLYHMLKSARTIGCCYRMFQMVAMRLI
jgi:hypothetical protein